jgi:hypothetical protein
MTHIRAMLCLAALISPAALFAQGPTARPIAVSDTTAVTGLVEDTTGAIIPNAAVALSLPNGTVIASATTDSAGRFRLSVARAADLRLTVTLAGFAPLIQTLHPSRAPLPLLILKMDLASVATSVTVNADDNLDATSTENNRDAASVSAADMKSLPILDGDILGTLSAFLDAGAAGEGGATLIVDGVEIKQSALAPSAIERISINQNPYSAQYRQPGRGQIEIVTKQIADKFHGEASFTFRDAALAATNHFATTKPPEQRRFYEGYLTGPVRPFQDTTFLFSIQRHEQDSYAQLTALAGPSDEAFTGNILVPYRSTVLSAKVAHQISDRHSLSLQYSLFDSGRQNNNVGGFNLASAGYTTSYFDMNLSFHDDLTLGPNKLNQFNFLFERNIDGDSSNQKTPSIVVQGFFTAGGAQLDSLATEYNPDVADIFSWTHKRHQWKFGVQLPNMGRRILEDNTNRGGTYTFASLAAYQSGTPGTFTLQAGQSRFLTFYLQPSAFVLDQIQLTPRLTLTPGLRYDWQNAFPGTTAAVQPRLALAYELDKTHAMVLRTGGGLYMRRVGVNVRQQLARYEHAAEQSFVLKSNICYNPAQQCNTLAAQPPSLFTYAPGISAPFQGFFGLSLEREVTKNSTLTIGYEGFRGWHALRTVDINAPVPPYPNTIRPNPNFAQINQLRSDGNQRTDSLVVSFKGRLTNAFSGFMQYTYGHARANTEFSTFQPSNQYDPNAEWSRTDRDQRHRLNLFGTFFPDRALNLGIGFNAYSPQPYSITTGTDTYDPGLFNARPAGVPRNSLNGGNFQDLQTRITYTRKLRPQLKDASPAVALNLSSFNTLNRSNYEDFVGVITSPRFGQPTSAASPRRLQLGLSYSF